jgi:hypothetical protein
MRVTYGPSGGGRGKRFAVAMVLVALVVGGYAYYRNRFDLPAVTVGEQGAAETRSEAAPPMPSSTKDDETGTEIAKTPVPGSNEINSAPNPTAPAATMAGSSQTNSESATTRDANPPPASGTSSDQCPEAVQALGLCRSMAKK